MGGLTDLRKMIQDRRESETGIATLRFPVCLAPELVVQYRELESEKEKRAELARRQGALVVADSADLEERQHQLETQIEATTVTAVFRALPGREYDALLVRHPGWNNDRSVMNEMYEDLMVVCYRYTLDPDGEKQELPIQELFEAINSGTLDAMSDAVLSLNRDKVDFPFSSRS